MMKLVYSTLMMSSLMILFLILIPSNNKFIHPILLGLTLLISTIFSSINISIFYENHWFSFLMFLTLIGGMMILFLYFTSFHNNIKMSIKWNFIKMFPIKYLLLIMFSSYLSILMFKYLWLFYSPENSEINTNNFMNSFNLMFMYSKKKYFLQ